MRTTVPGAWAQDQEKCVAGPVQACVRACVRAFVGGEVEEVGLSVRLRRLFKGQKLTAPPCPVAAGCAGTNISTSEEVAIKLESVKSKHPQLLYE